MNKKKKIMIACLILLLSIGFASIATNLIINNISTVGKNIPDFDINFTKAVIDGVDSPSKISDDKKTISYTTNTLKTLNDTSVLNYEITNNSNNYDATVSIDCTNKSTDYYDIVYDTPSRINSKSTERGSITVKLTRVSVENKVDTESVKCKLTIVALERDALGTVTYSASGILRDASGNPIANKTVMAFSSPKYSTTSSDGYFFIGGLEKGSNHEIYISDKSTIDLQAMSSDEERKSNSMKIADASIAEDGTVTYTALTGYSITNPLTVSKKWNYEDLNGNGTIDIDEKISIELNGGLEEFYIYREEGDFYWAIRTSSLQNSIYGSDKTYTTSTVKGIVDAYMTNLNNANADVLEASLISIEELETVFKCPTETGKCKYARYQNYIENENKWWTRSSTEENKVYALSNKSISLEDDLSSELGVRPVIKIAKGQFNVDYTNEENNNTDNQKDTPSEGQTTSTTTTTTTTTTTSSIAISE